MGEELKGEKTMKKRSLYYVSMILLCLLFSVCVTRGKKGFAQEISEPVVVATDSGITATPEPEESIELEAAFDKKTIKLYPKESAKNNIWITGEYDKIRWSVSNKAYASITQKGKVTLKKKGAGKKVTVTAKITYTRNDETYTKSLSYVVKGQRSVTKLTILADQNYVFVKKRLRLSVKYAPKNASNGKVTWSTSNKKYATISKKGVVHPNKAGAGKTVTFTARTVDGSKVEQSIAIRIIDASKPMIALTFDDGPSYTYTSRIVNQLKKYDARATFFVLGCKLGDAASKSLVKSSFEYGNEIASHTYNHKQLSALSAVDIKWESDATKSAIKKITGSNPLLTRPPYGAYNDTVKATVDTPLILWSIDTRDWETRNADSTVYSVLNSVKDGDIVLMHDIYDTTATAAERLIPELVKRGYQLVTVSELAVYKKAELLQGQSYSAIR